ncbi:hypothetical protein WJX72_004922 [[Myrmecia] bisecta]|uniref:1-phosphatidylinositol 4-kinase n=1 Tax=[Myrmecia] bisecta TaxID=41462 RepID=A0AAW1R6W7_9CHLO
MPVLPKRQRDQTLCKSYQYLSADCDSCEQPSRVQLGRSAENSFATRDLTLPRISCKAELRVKLAGFKSGRVSQHLTSPRGLVVRLSADGFVRVQGFDVKSSSAFDKPAAAFGKHASFKGGSSKNTKQAVLRTPAVQETGFKGLLALCNAGPITPISPQGLANTGRVEVVGTAHTTAGVRNLVKAVVRGLRACQVPVPVEGGLGGTYLFLSEAGRKCGIVKPCDEEPLACNNPKGYIGRNLGDPGLKPTVRIPCKLGSLQEFVSHECDTSEIGMSQFSSRDVHRIGILDLRLFNTDRHAGNILVRRPRGSSANLSALARLEEDKLELIPIDHGFALPEALEPPYFEWLFWPQAMIPFDEEELSYIEALDPTADADLLRREVPSLHEGCLRLLEVSTSVLKHCAAAGLSLAEIGTVVSRPLVGLDEESSELEKLCLQAREEADAAGASGSASLDSLDSLEESESDGGESMSESEEESEATTRMGSFLKMTRRQRLAGRQHSGSGPGLHGMLGITRAFTDSSFEICCTESPYTRTTREEVLPPAAALRSSRDEDLASVASMRSSQDELLPFPCCGPEEQTPVGPQTRPLVSVQVDPWAPAQDSDCDSPVSPDSVISNLFSSQGSLSSTTMRAPSGLIRHSSMDSGIAPAYPSPRRDLMGMSAYPGGMKWRGSPQRQRSSRQRSRADTLKPRRMTGGQAYPPPVAGAAPHTISTVLAGMDAEAWGLFMAALVRLLEAALREGRWKQAAQQGPMGLQNLGVSCPRF